MVTTKKHAHKRQIHLGLFPNISAELLSLHFTTAYISHLPLIDKPAETKYIPFIIVKQLTEEIIVETITAYAEKDDAYWLKLYHFANDIDTFVFNQLQAKHIEYLKELDELDNS